MSGCGYDEDANEASGLQGGVKIMAMPYKKDNALCSPTSALEKKQMLSRLGEEVKELRTLPDGQEQSYSGETLGMTMARQKMAAG
jgi:hypothetical protein